MEVIMATHLYRSGDYFSAAEMVNACKSINCRSRMTMLLREMQDLGYTDRVKRDGLVKYKKPFAGMMLKKRWISEKAERICAGHITRELAGQTARDALRSAKAFATTNKATCRDSL
jgi:hypothetical protein